MAKLLTSAGPINRQLSHHMAKCWEFYQMNFKTYILQRATDPHDEFRNSVAPTPIKVDPPCYSLYS
jgi:hypothetical protein